MIEALEGRVFLSASLYSPSSVRRPVVAALMRTVEPAKKRGVTNILSVSADGRYLVQSNGTPFFYMADTAWQLFNRTTKADADLYLTTRARQGFTVIQAEVNTRFGGNKYGDRAFINDDPTQPNEAFFDYVDYVVNRAGSLGMYISFVPLDTRWASRGVFTAENVYQYGRFLGARYGSSKIIWTLGGDIGADEAAGGLDMWRNLAAGIARGAAGRDQSKVMINYHPGYNQSSSKWFQGDSWLDMNSVQSGHGQNTSNYNLIMADYNKTVHKPVMDAEAGYEAIPAGIVAGNPRLTDYDVRKSAYWSLFAGSHGVTFGNNNVWQFVTSVGGRSLSTATWKNSLETAGANSMTVLKRLMLSRPFLNRVPDQSLLVGSALSGTDHIQATRASDGSYAFIYTAGGKAVTVNLSKLSGSQVVARWFNPRTGRSSVVGTFAKTGTRTFTSPAAGADWVLVLDDASRRYGKP